MISEEEVRHVAELARLGLTDDEVNRMGEQLGDIIGAVEKIGELDLSGVEPTASPMSFTGALRPDEPHEELSQEEALAPAPESVDGLFSVPRID